MCEKNVHLSIAIGWNQKIIRCDLCHFSVLLQMLIAWALHVSSAIKADVNLEVF